MCFIINSLVSLNSIDGCLQKVNFFRKNIFTGMEPRKIEGGGGMETPFLTVNCTKVQELMLSFGKDNGLSMAFKSSMTCGGSSRLEKVGITIGALHPIPMMLRNHFRETTST